MSAFAKQVFWYFVAICAVVYAYGMGFQRGMHQQLTYDQVIDICAAQFFEAVKQRQKEKRR